MFSFGAVPTDRRESLSEVEWDSIVYILEGSQIHGMTDPDTLLYHDTIDASDRGCRDMRATATPRSFTNPIVASLGLNKGPRAQRLMHSKILPSGHNEKAVFSMVARK
jgi:hypothetical protein